jgi:hypothetical protein
MPVSSVGNNNLLSTIGRIFQNEIRGLDKGIRDVAQGGIKGLQTVMEESGQTVQELTKGLDEGFTDIPEGINKIIKSVDLFIQGLSKVAVGFIRGLYDVATNGRFSGSHINKKYNQTF